MRDIWKIIRFTRDLWRYYVAISLFTILIAIVNQLQPLFTKGAIDQITKLSGGHVDVLLVASFAGPIAWFRRRAAAWRAWRERVHARSIEKARERRRRRPDKPVVADAPPWQPPEEPALAALVEKSDEIPICPIE